MPFIPFNGGRGNIAEFQPFLSLFSIREVGSLEEESGDSDVELFHLLTNPIFAGKHGID